MVQLFDNVLRFSLWLKKKKLYNYVLNLQHVYDAYIGALFKKGKSRLAYLKTLMRLSSLNIMNISNLFNINN